MARLVRGAAVTALVVAATTFGLATPALADAGFTVDHTLLRYVPTIGGVSGPTQTYTVTASGLDDSFHLHIESTAPGGVTLGRPAQGLVYKCTSTSPTVDCDISGLDNTSMGFPVGYSADAMNAALGTNTALDYTATATLTETLPSGHVGNTVGTIKTQLGVRPAADLALSNGVSIDSNGNPAHLRFSVQNRGPTGSATTTVTITGFQDTGLGLPADCQASGATVTCVSHAAPTVDDSHIITLPIPPGQAGCPFVINVTGVFPDPVHANNTLSQPGDHNLPCSAGPGPSTSPTASGPTPTATPTATATKTPGKHTKTSAPPTAAVPSTNPSAAGPAITHVADSGPTGSGSDAILWIAVAIGVLLIAGGAVIGLRVLRRRPPSPGLDDTMEIPL